jgi:hypothetical protein
MFRDIPKDNNDNNEEEEDYDEEYIGEEYIGENYYRWDIFFKLLTKNLIESFDLNYDIPIHKQNLEYWLRFQGKIINLKIDDNILRVGSDQKVLDWDSYNVYIMDGLDLTNEMNLLNEVGISKDYVLFKNSLLET